MSANEGADQEAPTSVYVDKGSNQKPLSSVYADEGATETTASERQDEPGVAKIKHEYLLLDYKPIIDTEYISDKVRDELKNEVAEKKDDGATEEEPAAKKVKLTGRNKKRPKRKRIQAGDKICPAIARDQNCSFGNKCKFSHDKSKFMAAKLPDISDQCFVFETYGKCPFGLSCRFGSKHVTEDLKNIVKENFNDEKLNSSVKNVLKKDNQVLLWKRKYDFSKANAVIDEMGCRNPKEKQGAWNSKKDMDKSNKLDAAGGDRTKKDQKAECIAEEINVNTGCDKDIVEKTADITDADKGHASDDSKDCGDSNVSNTAEINLSETISDKGDVVKLLDNTISSGAGNSSINSVNHISSQMQKNGLSEDASIEKKSSLGASTLGKDNSLGMDVDEGVIRLRPLEKKKVNFADKLYLAPLTTVGNLPFRRICKRLGADITCGEMAVATNLLQGQASEWALLKRHESEDFFGVQICGAYPDTMTRCAQIINDTLDVDFVDINCGCPIDLIFNKGEGSALMGRAGKFGQIVKGMTSVLDVPLTVKMRTGIYNDKNNAHTLVPKLKEWGVALATIHGRSRVQRYTKTADWDYISECARLAAPMPLFGNGDILSYEEANERREHTGVSGLMIARGALIKPWIFTEIKEQRHWDISASERFDILRDFTNFGLEHWGSDQQGVESTRRFLLEWLSFLYRYIPVGVLERLPQKINERPPYYKGRNDLETLMASPSCGDWVKISEMLLGPVPEDFTFLPKHKANAYK